MKANRVSRRGLRPKSFLECTSICLVGSILLGFVLFWTSMIIAAFANQPNPGEICILIIAFLNFIHCPLYYVLLQRRKEPSASLLVFAGAATGTIVMMTLIASMRSPSLALLLLMPIGLWLGYVAAYSFVPNEPLPGNCECGYDLRGLPEPRCPECGLAFDPNRPDLVIESKSGSI